MVIHYATQSLSNSLHKSWIKCIPCCHGFLFVFKWKLISQLAIPVCARPSKASTVHVVCLSIWLSVRRAVMTACRRSCGMQCRLDGSWSQGPLLISGHWRKEPNIKNEHTVGKRRWCMGSRMKAESKCRTQKTSNNHKNNQENHMGEMKAWMEECQC